MNSSRPYTFIYQKLQVEYYSADSIYQAIPDVREIAIKAEEQNKRNREKLQKARDMEREAGEMKRKVFQSNKVESSNW